MDKDKISFLILTDLDLRVPSEDFAPEMDLKFFISQFVLFNKGRYVFIQQDRDAFVFQYFNLADIPMVGANTEIEI